MDNSDELMNFECIRKIGQGAHGDVYLTQKGNQLFAVKITKVEENRIPSSFLREASILRELNHENVITLVQAWIANNAYIVTPYHHYNLKNIHIDGNILSNIMEQLLEGLDYIHKCGFIHMDIKPSNIVISADGRVKYIDFGLSSKANCYDKELYVITRWYRPPELLLGCEQYDKSVDIWSLGCVFDELFLGKPILMGKCQSDQITKIFQLCGTPNNEIWPGVEQFPNFPDKAEKFQSSFDQRHIDIDLESFELLQAMLQCNPQNRMTAHNCLRYKKGCHA
jgi:serine/threonine protein kinase